MTLGIPMPFYLMDLKMQEKIHFEIQYLIMREFRIWN